MVSMLCNTAQDLVFMKLYYLQTQRPNQVYKSFQI
jgi:hypothetical protein